MEDSYDGKPEKAIAKPIFSIPITGKAAKQLSSSGTAAQLKRKGDKNKRPPTPPKEQAKDNK